MTDKDFYDLIAQELNLRPFQVANTVELLDGGSTVPFIARYRKEATGKLDEEEIRAVEERIKYLRLLTERRTAILSSIEEQGKLTPELKAKINAAMKMQELEDLYLPYKRKKRTRATIAREKGLEPLADTLLKQDITSGSLADFAAKFVDSEKEVEDIEQALAGARDIIAETISDDAVVRKKVRERSRRTGILVSRVKKGDDDEDFEMYHDFSEPITKLVPHRILAMNRGEREKVLSIGVDVTDEEMTREIESLYIRNKQSIFRSQIEEAIGDSYKRLISPSIERELRNELTERADAHAIDIFAGNLKSLLLQAPIRNKIIMGIDPGYRSGCKVAVIDKTGKYMAGSTIFPHPPQNKTFDAKTTLRKMIDKFDVELIAIGNGTASRETEALAAELLSEIKQRDADRDLFYMIVNEAGASVYSASKVAKSEFPDLDASMRGNISIARRVLDPLAELVKIDPKHIGVGLYQHDVNQKELSEALDNVVESAVNMVGVDLNTASASLLKHVSGLTSRTAENIVKHRDENGRFDKRSKLKKVAGIGGVAYEQAAGFLRIPDGAEPLDNTGIHPESYAATKKLLALFKIEKDPSRWRDLSKLIQSSGKSVSALAKDIGVGEPTLEDIISNLEKPGRDPRDAMPKPILKSDVLKIDDLREGMTLKGTVRNVVDFGAFVDIGLKRDGLVHISELANRFVKNPMDVVSVGDVVNVRVLSVDLERGRVQLSMKTQ